MKALCLVFLNLVFLSLASSAQAQQRPGGEAKARPAESASPRKEPPVKDSSGKDSSSKDGTESEAVEAPPPPYEPQIIKLAEIMGSLAFLSELCGPPAGVQQSDIWRQKAQQFLNAEPMSEARKQRFAGAYNRGLQGYKLVYRSCTPNARLSVERLLSDGAKLTRELVGRFGS